MNRFSCTICILALTVLTMGCMTNPPAETALSPEEAEVMDVIVQLFDGMRAGDSTMVYSAFHPQAQNLVSTGIRDGMPVVGLTPIDRFLVAAGQPHEQVWDEQIWDYEVRVRDNLATVWTKYVFYVGEQFSHCGVDAIQLVKTDAGGWQIINLADTRQTENCEMPPEE